MIKNNVRGLGDVIVDKVPSGGDPQMIANVIGALLFGLIGMFIGHSLKGPLGGATGGGLFSAATYESFDKLLPDDYYGSGRASRIDFSNRPPMA